MKYLRLYGVFSLSLLVWLGLGLLFGSTSIPLDWFIDAILFHDYDNNAVWHTIVWQIRLPRLLTAAVAGWGLALCGLHMQTLLTNPLADPYVLGISSGASLGAALVILLSGGSLLSHLNTATFSTPAAASMGALLTMMVVLWLGRHSHRNTTLLLVGVMLGYLLTAMVSVLILFSQPDSIQQYLLWSFGSFSDVSWFQWLILLLVVSGATVLSLILAKTMNAWLAGGLFAQSLGISITRYRLISVAITATIIGCITAFCGPIAFIGLAVPHLARAVAKTADHHHLVPLCGLLGANVALATDWLANVPGSDLVLPINAITALIGAPFIIWILTRHD